MQQPRVRYEDVATGKPADNMKRPDRWGMASGCLNVDQIAWRAELDRVTERVRARFGEPV